MPVILIVPNERVQSLLAMFVFLLIVCSLSSFQSSSGVSMSVVQSVAFAVSPPCSPLACCPPNATPQGQSALTAEGQNVLVHKRLEQTSTSLQAALQVVERKLAQDDPASR